MAHRKVQIGIAASSSLHPKPVAKEKAIRFARKLAEHREEVVLLTGGGGGLMTVVSEEYVKHGGIVVGVIPLEIENVAREHPRWNPYNTVEIYSSMSFQARSIPLVRSSDAFVCLGGEAGTLIEVLVAYLNSKPTICITGTGYLTDKLVNIVDEEGYLDSRKNVKIIFEKDPEKAAELAYRLGKETVRRKFQ